MRVSPEIINYLKQSVQKHVPGASVYLFGSRTDDQARGGDIDMMILSEKQVEKKTLRKIRLDFYKKYGWQKIDLVNFMYDEQSTFREMISDNCIEL